MSKLFAEIISLVLNPLVLLVPLPFFLVYETTNNFSDAVKWAIVSIVFIFLFFSFILLGIKKGFFSNLDVSKKKQRSPLFFFGIILGLIYLAVLYFFHGPIILSIGVTAIILGLSILELINKFIKVSVHLATLSSLFTFLILIEGWLFVFCFILIPVLMWSRIKTKNHTLLETLVGTLLGILLTMGIYVIFKYIIYV